MRFCLSEMSNRKSNVSSETASSQAGRQKVSGEQTAPPAHTPPPSVRQRTERRNNIMTSYSTAWKKVGRWREIFDGDADRWRRCVGPAGRRKRIFTLGHPAVATPRFAASLSDGRRLQHADGTPFFWLGDTAWALHQNLSREDVDGILTTRQRPASTWSS